MVSFIANYNIGFVMTAVQSCESSRPIDVNGSDLLAPLPLTVE